MSHALHESLLHDEPVASERRSSSPWAYTLWGILVVSVFVLYHVSVLLVWNLPSKGLVKTFHSSFLEKVKGKQYFGGTRNNQSWAMFAPNPNRTNNFVHVYVEDFEGEVWDFEQDIWNEDRYPYFWYSREGKINRRIDGKKSFQRMYGAWVCREWERQHGGEPAKNVRFIRRVTRVPHAKEVRELGGWDQWQAPSEQTEQRRSTARPRSTASCPTSCGFATTSSRATNSRRSGCFATSRFVPGGTRPRTSASEPRQAFRPATTKTARPRATTRISERQSIARWNSAWRAGGCGGHVWGVDVRAGQAG